MSKPARIIIVDTEATSPSPFSGVMTEFGAVDFLTRDTFHGTLHDWQPTPGTPALPQLTGIGPGPRYQTNTDESPIVVGSVTEVMEAFSDWLAAAGGKPQFWSDNPAFDWQWMSYAFDSTLHTNPFGYSGRRIGDLAAGLSGNFRNTNKWKTKRRTKHDHNPVNDAMGNAEALKAILDQYDQNYLNS